MTQRHDLAVWRHPRPVGAEGRCVGRIDLPVDPRRVRRLADRIRRAARREGRPSVVFTSPARRCQRVGRYLRRYGWLHRVDARLLEADFGAWDGYRWDDLGRDVVDAWVRDFAGYRPGGGELVHEVVARCRAFLDEVDGARACVVTHGGWISALEWTVRAPAGASGPQTAAEWPRALGYGRRWADREVVRSDRAPAAV